MSKRNGVPSGQAVLEYMLLLVIVLAILGGVLYQFNDAFRVYSKKLFVGEESYIGCLIKYGILPGADSEACPRPTFNLADGKRLPGSGSASGDSKNANNSAANNGASSSGRASDRSTGTIGFNMADQKNTGIKSDSVKAGGKDSGAKTSTGNDGFSSGSTTSQSDGSSENPSGSFANGRGRRPISTDESIQEKAATSVPLTTRDMKSARELAAEKKKKAKAIDDAESADFSFSNIFKYLVIAALVFGIIFFIGSQFLAVSRSKRRK